MCVNCFSSVCSQGVNGHFHPPSVPQFLSNPLTWVGPYTMETHCEGMDLFSVTMCNEEWLQRPIHFHACVHGHVSFILTQTWRKKKWTCPASEMKTSVPGCCCTCAGLWSSPGAPGETGRGRPSSSRSAAAGPTTAAPRSPTGGSSERLKHMGEATRGHTGPSGSCVCPFKTPSEKTDR